MASIRRLAAILAADMAGYSRLMGSDEEGTHGRLRALHREIIDPKIAGHRGRIVKTTGDGLLAEFPSIVDAVRCAVKLQHAMAERNAEVPDIYGDGVNVAARLEALAEPGGVYVSGTVHDHVRDRLPFVFEDLGEQRVKNIARPVRIYRYHEASAANQRSLPPVLPALPLPDKPSIAVLPFQNLSGDPEQEYFADGMVEEIITALSRIRWLFVIARNSTFTYKSQAIDVKGIGRELGVRYVLEGSVRKAGNRVRITAQLIEAQTSTHLWADRFDGALEDIFDLQDRVASSVAGVIEPELQAAETARATGRPPANLTAYDAYLRAFAMLFSSTKQILPALALLEDAIKRDAKYGPALAWAAVCCQRLCIDGSSRDLEADKRKALDYAGRAVLMAPEDPITLANAAMALAYFGEDIGAMVGLVDHALALNPSYARGWYISGILSMWVGDQEAAIDRGKTALRLSPRGGIGTVHSLFGHALFLSRRFDEAVPKLLFAIQHEQHPATYRFLAACYAHMGRLDEARDVVRRLRAITPVITFQAMHFRDRQQRELLLSGLRLAINEKV